MRRFFFLSALVFVVACGATKMVAPVQADADRGTAKYPGLTLAQLTEGKAVYDQNCGACHKLPKPTSQSEAEWKQIVPKMTAKSNRKLGNTIDAAKEESLLRFLIVMSGN